MYFPTAISIVLSFFILTVGNIGLVYADGMEVMISSEGSAASSEATLDAGGIVFIGSSPEVAALASTAVVISIAVVAYIQYSDDYQEDKKAIIAAAAQLILDQEAVNPNLNAPLSNILQNPNIDSTAKKSLIRTKKLLEVDFDNGVANFSQLPERVQALTILEINKKLQVQE